MERDRRAGRPRAGRRRSRPRDVLSDALRPPARGPRAGRARRRRASPDDARRALDAGGSPNPARPRRDRHRELPDARKPLRAPAPRPTARVARRPDRRRARRPSRRRRVSSVGRSERDRDRGRGAEGRRRRRLRSSSSPRRRLAARLLGVPPPAKRATELILRGLARRTEPRRGRGGRSEARIRVFSPGSRRRRRRRPRGRRPRPRAPSSRASSPKKPARGPSLALGPRDARRRPKRTPTLRRRSSSPRGG